MAALLDVNALIALVDSDHVNHREMRQWFKANHKSNWATCPVTENGLVRILAQARYASGRRAPAEGIEILAALKDQFSESHEFWPDTLSLTDPKIFLRDTIAGPRQITDVYLAALAARHGGTVVSFDRSFAWQAIRGGSTQLVQRPDL